MNYVVDENNKRKLLIVAIHMKQFPPIRLHRQQKLLESFNGFFVIKIHDLMLTCIMCKGKAVRSILMCAAMMMKAREK